ncbi:MAG: alkaline phosphatase D family protein [Burkholderiales bacterium]|nr:alkaline phosphatase D family protein [Opitutaceae bacterium]
MLPRVSLGLLALALASLATPLVHAAGQLFSGPLLGYQTHREVAIWLETENAREVSLTYTRADLPPDTAADSPAARPVTVTLPAPAPMPAGGQPMKFILGPLEMGARYTYTLAIDGEPAPRPYPLGFRTTLQHEFRGAAPDFSFLLGSCAYFNEPPYDRPGRPYGSDSTIWTPMAASGADFMLWLGDNTYLREADFSSTSGIWHRYRHDRATTNLQPFLAAMPHYASWDDHDYGPNNANRSYHLKDVTRAAFTAYWPNPSAGSASDPAAIFTRLQWADAQFILLDNRTHRDDSTVPDTDAYHKSQYGRAQLEWLKQQLAIRNEGGARRHLKLTFIATGSQFLSERFYPGSEDHARYPAEREEIIEFIRANKIGGVVFLSGDVHYTEVMRRDGKLPYPLYEFTSSALTAGAHTGKLPEDAGRLLAVQQNNYSRIAVSGPPDARVLLFTTHDPAGAELGRVSVNVADLAWPAEPK